MPAPAYSIRTPRTWAVDRRGRRHLGRQAATPVCLSKDSVGVLKNGVALFAPVDERNRDAVAYETQDKCDGHPQRSSTYNHNSIPSCILKAASGPSTVVGYALDGFPIVVERDRAGDLPTNADLDECHGRVAPILIREGSDDLDFAEHPGRAELALRSLLMIVKLPVVPASVSTSGPGRPRARIDESPPT
jgi:hypothetical protein